MNCFEYDEEGYDKRGFDAKGMNINGTMYDSRGRDFLGYDMSGQRIGEKIQEDEYVDESLEEKKQELYEETMRKNGNDDFADEIYEMKADELARSYEEWEQPEQPEEQTLQEELEGVRGMNLEQIKANHPNYAKAISSVEGKIRTIMIWLQCRYDLYRLEEISKVLNESDSKNLWDSRFLEYQDEIRDELISLADIYGDLTYDYEYDTLDFYNDYNNIIEAIRSKLEIIQQAVPEQYRGIQIRVQVDSHGNILLHDKDEIGDTISDKIGLEDIKNTVSNVTLERYTVASEETREGIEGTKDITTEQSSHDGNDEQVI